MPLMQTKKYLKVIAWIVGVPLGLVVLFVASVIGYIVVVINTDIFLPSNVESPPSVTVKQALTDEKFFFGTGDTIYSTVGYQKWADEVISSDGSYDRTWAKNYFYPSRSPDKQFLVFYKTYDKCVDVTEKIPDEFMVELVLRDLNTGTDKIVFTSDQANHTDFKGNRLCGWWNGNAGRSYDPYFVVGWLDGDTFSFNFINLGLAS